VKLALEQYLNPMLARNMDVLVLGCTHYPILRPAIEKVVGPKVRVIDSAQQCAQDVARRLRLAGLLRPITVRPGRMRCFVTDDPMRFALLAQRFMGGAVEPPTLVEPDTLYKTSETATRVLRTAG
jgi:glutamate racemase